MSDPSGWLLVSGRRLLTARQQRQLALAAANRLQEHRGSVPRCNSRSWAVAIDQIDHRRLEHEITTVDPGIVAIGFFLELGHGSAFEVQGAIAPGGLHGGEGGLAAFGTVMGDELLDIDIGDTIPVGEAKRVGEVIAHPSQATTGHRPVAGIDKRDLPGFGFLTVLLHVVEVHVKRHIGGMEKVISEILLDHISFVSTADHEVVDAVVAVGLEDVPEDGFAAHLDHGLGPQVRLFCQAGAETTGEDDGLHRDRGLVAASLP